MNVFKYRKISIDNYRIDGDTLSFSIWHDSCENKKHIVVPEFMDKDVFYDIYRLALGVSSYAYALVAEEVYIDIPFSSAQTDFLKRIKPSFYSNLRIFLGNIIMSPDCIGDVYYDTDAEFKEKVPKRFVPNTATLLYSGGKESLLSDIILNEAGIPTRKLLVNSGLYEDASKIVNFKDCNVIDSSYAFLFDESVIYEGTWDNPAFAFERIVFALIDMVSNGRQYLCVGNEYECTAWDFNNLGGSLSFGRSWQQSNFALKEFQRYLYLIGHRGEVFSPVQNMTAVFEEGALAFVYPNRLDDQCSCTSTLVEKGELQPCLSCVKCKILNATLIGFNKILAKNGMPTLSSIYITDDSVTTVDMNPVHYLEHYLDDEQLEQIEKLCRGEFEPEWFWLNFDTLHSEKLLPSRVLKVVKNIEVSLNKITEKWKV